MPETVESVLAKERSEITFNPTKLSEFLYGKEFYSRMKETLQKNPTLPYNFNFFNGGRVAIIKKSIEDFPTVYNLIKDKGLCDQNFIYLTLVCMNQMPGGVHLAMFMKCIEIMGSEEQNEEYMDKCNTLEILGCYAQTEMAHGSDVSSLMTTATLDLETDQFIVDTPSIKATKFWPGELGLYSTHALVFAQLIIKGKKYGVNAFVVPIRDKNLKPYPGVDVGDIGPKIGYHSKDNGYLIMTKVRIPRKNILSRFMTVTKEGQIEIKGDPKVSYATMMEIRRHISCTWIKVYASAITIAARYSCYRKQFKDSAGQEIPIIDYQLQQEKIIQRVAEYYAVSTAGNQVSEIAHLNAKLVQQEEDFSLMAETHACLSLSKPYFSELAYDGMEVCRRACGGQGFSQYSGFPSLINEYAAHVTHEGEDTVLYLQVARYLLKCFKQFKMEGRKLGQSVKYLQSFDLFLETRVSALSPQDWVLEDLRIIIAQSVCYLLNCITQKLINKEEGFSDKDAWNYSAGIRLRQLAMMHSALFTFASFKDSVDKEIDEKVKELTRDLCLTFGINVITYSPITSAIFEGGFLKPKQIDALHQLKQILLKRLRPSLIGLVDGFGIPDKYIRSALTYGNPYENFLALARENELNKGTLESEKVVRNIVNHMKNPNPTL